MGPDGLSLDMLRRYKILPLLISLVISHFITMWSYVLSNPTEVTYGNEIGFWHIPFVLLTVIRLCSIGIDWRHSSHCRSLNKRRLTFVFSWRGRGPINITGTYLWRWRLLASQNFIELHWSDIHPINRSLSWIQFRKTNFRVYSKIFFFRWAWQQLFLQVVQLSFNLLRPL